MVTYSEAQSLISEVQDSKEREFLETYARVAFERPVTCRELRRALKFVGGEWPLEYAACDQDSEHELAALLDDFVCRKHQDYYRGFSAQARAVLDCLAEW